ncbi:MAG: cytochrome c maturation protein CcmE [Ardenticatenia bacterium]|nr:cytochrome c maturation protein CcmE [Ardenticatenia bacterium]
MTTITYEQPKIGPIPKRKLKFVIGGVVALLSIVALIVNGLVNASNYYITLEEALSQGNRLVGKGLRINAVVDKESVQYDPKNIVLTFDLVDEAGRRVPVVYRDVMPDLFMKSESVIVEGRLNEKGVFEADMILVKCPSKYEEAIEAGEQVPTNHLTIPTQSQ